MVSQIPQRHRNTDWKAILSTYSAYLFDFCAGSHGTSSSISSSVSSQTTHSSFSTCPHPLLVSVLTPLICDFRWCDHPRDLVKISPSSSVSCHSFFHDCTHISLLSVTPEHCAVSTPNTNSIGHTFKSRKP